MQQQFTVTGMSCALCKMHVENAVRALPAVHQAQVNLLQNRLSVQYDETRLSATQIIQAVEQAGYQARQIPTAIFSASDTSETAQLKKRFWKSVLFLIPLITISMGPICQTLPILQLLLALPILSFNIHFFTHGFVQLFKRTPTMDSLVALGAGAAFVQSTWALLRGQQEFYFESAAMIVTLVTLGKWIESRAKNQTTHAISALVKLLPAEVHVRRNNRDLRISTHQLIPGDLLLIHSGDRIGADGVIYKGTGTVDESMLTGESLPLEKSPGKTVTAGTTLTSGYLEVTVQKTGEDMLLSQMISLVEQATNSKAPVARLADRVSQIFVPVVIGLAVLTFLVWGLCGAPLSFALSCAICVLVISCPCALGLAMPTAITVGMGMGAKRGILIKSAQALERTRAVTIVVLDKTGTVTTGQMEVTQLFPAKGIHETTLLKYAASLEKPSGHPLAKALVRFAMKQGNIPLQPVSHFQEFPGLGVQAKEQEEPVYGGNLKAMQLWHIEVPQADQILQQAAQNGQTILFFARAKKYLGAVGLADAVKENSKEAVSLLHQAGIQTILLTGDSPLTAQYVAQQTGIQQVQAGVLPLQKQQFVANLQAHGDVVAMVGDGLNDALSLTQADVGIALGAGTEVAIAAADLVLMRPDLREVATALALSRATLLNIQENLFWAFFYNVCCIPLAAGVFYPIWGWKLHPMIAAAVMSMSSVCVVANALRLYFFKQPFTNKKQEIYMHKTIKIQGMMCNHCARHVERALNALPGVKAQVNLSSQTATVESALPIEDSVLIEAVQNAGYEVTAIY